MSRLTKKEREAIEQEAKERIVQIMSDYPDGIVLIDWVSGNATNTGRTDRYSVKYVAKTGTDFEVFHIGYNVARVAGYRVNRDMLITIGGYGYSKSNEIADSIARIIKRPFRVEGCMCSRIQQYNGER